MDSQYEYQEYPKAVYKAGKDERIDGWVPPLPYLMKTVDSADEEIAALDDGWSTTPPEAKGDEKPILKAKVAA